MLIFEMETRCSFFLSETYCLNIINLELMLRSALSSKFRDYRFLAFCLKYSSVKTKQLSMR